MAHEGVVERERPLPGAEIERLRGVLKGALLLAGDPGYDEARTLFNRMIDRRPALIVRCSEPADVVAAVDFARENELLVSVRCGGHNVTGNAVCDGGLMIDLSPMKRVEVDTHARTARLEAGLTWAEANDALQPHGLAATGGFVGTTGVAGLTLGGGLGWMVRKHGLACDNLLAAEMVTADGRLVTASAQENPDLFWGLRGGGGNFGVVTSFDFKVHPVGIALAGLVIHPLAAGPEVLRFWRDFTTTAPEEFNSTAILMTAPPAPFVPAEAHGAPVVALGGVCIGPMDAAEEIVRPLREFGPPVADIFQPMPYSAAQTMADDLWPHGFLNYWKSSMISEYTDEALDTLLAHFAEVPSPLTSAVLEHNGDGALERVGADETAFGHRDCRYNLLIPSLWDDPADTDRNIDWTRRLWEATQPFGTGEVYVNYLGSEGEDRVKAAYGPQKYERLVALKNKYDPTNLFRLNQNIKPSR